MKISEYTVVDDTGEEPLNSDHHWIKQLPGLMRSFGAIAVLVSLYSFMMSGWEGSSDLIRYGMLLGHTALLAVIALISGHILKEGKGPRLLLMLALVAVPVNCAIMGAFLLSALQGDTNAFYPTYVMWSVDSLGTALLTMAGAMLILLLVIVLGFRTLVRNISWQMSGLFLLSNAAILLPVRQTIDIALLSLVLGGLTLFFTTKNMRHKTEIKTLEGATALLLQFLPITILLGRNIWLYSPSELLTATSAIMCFAALRQCTHAMSKKSLLRVLSELASVAPALVSGVSVVGILSHDQAVPSIAMIAGSMLAASLVYEISLRASHYACYYRIVSMLVAVVGAMSNLLFNGGLLASLCCLVLGVALMIASCEVRQRSILIGGIALTLAGVIDQFHHVLGYFDFNYWVVLAIAGVLAIVMASLIETRGLRIKQSFIEYKARFSQWNY